MTVVYEWDVETITTVESDEFEAGEILDHHFCTSYAEAVKAAGEEADEGTANVIVLVRDDDSGRSWAYMTDGVLPTYFEDAHGVKTAKVPARYTTEVDTFKD